MAVNAAHLTRTLNEKPSIFEVIAQESLQSTIGPALKRLLEFISIHYPNKTAWSVRWFDEIYLILNTVLQYGYLRNYAASFSEYFYGLQRISLKSQLFNNGFNLSPSDERKSLLLLAVFPYLKHKMERLAQQYRYDEIDGVNPKDWRNKFRILFIGFHSAFHVLYEVLSLVQFLQYISGKSNSHSLALRILSLSLTYADNNEEDNSWSNFWSNMSSGKFSSASINFNMISTLLLRSMEIGAFFIQFMKWWEDKNSTMELSIMPIPEPPKADVRSSQYINKCPICFQEWKIPTVLPVSGYIFCYMCIVRHLDQHKKCPVTNYYARKDELIRVYF